MYWYSVASVQKLEQKGSRIQKSLPTESENRRCWSLYMFQNSAWRAWLVGEISV